MFLLARMLKVTAVAVAICVINVSCPAEEIFRWDFDQTDSGWTGNDQVQLSTAEGHLKLRAKGNDPYFSAPVQGRAGTHRLTISARFKGNADIQVFWTTEASPATSEDKSIRTELPDQTRSFVLPDCGSKPTALSPLCGSTRSAEAARWKSTALF